MTECSIMPDFDLIRGNTWGKLKRDHVMCTPFTGFDVAWSNDVFRCRLTPDGKLTVFAGSEWDFATGGIDTPAMVAASLMHDAFCHMTNAGKLPWSVRRRADNHFSAMIRKHGPRGGFLGWRTGLTYAASGWRWIVVSANSQLNARWRAEDYEND